MKDRIQIVSFCLFLLILQQSLAAWVLLAREGAGEALGIAQLGFCVLSYVALCCLALWFHRWAWCVCNAALTVALLTGMLSLGDWSTQGWAVRVMAAVAVLLASIGLWANLHPGTRLAVGLNGSRRSSTY